MFTTNKDYTAASAKWIWSTAQRVIGLEEDRHECFKELLSSVGIRLGMIYWVGATKWTKKLPERHLLIKAATEKTSHEVRIRSLRINRDLKIVEDAEEVVPPDAEVQFSNHAYDPLLEVDTNEYPDEIETEEYLEIKRHLDKI